MSGRPFNERGHARRAVFIKALLLREGKPDLPCTLVDISDSGARLVIDGASEVPNRFTIVMGEHGVPRRQCRLVWRGDREVGVAFDADKLSKRWDRELAPGNSLDDAIEAFVLRS